MTNVVIGAASGMGAAVARRLAPRGPLVIADRSVEGLEALRAELGGDVRALPCDITSQEQVEALFAEVDELDALVVTAGISSSGMDRGKPIFEVNLVGMARVLQAAESRLRPGTVAVGVASQSGYMVPDDPDLFAVLEDPLAPDFYERLGHLLRLRGPEPRLPDLQARCAPVGPQQGGGLGRAGRAHRVGVARDQRHAHEPRDWRPSSRSWRRSSRAARWGGAARPRRSRRSSRS